MWVCTAFSNAGQRSFLALMHYSFHVQKDFNHLVNTTGRIIQPCSSITYTKLILDDVFRQNSALYAKHSP